MMSSETFHRFAFAYGAAFAILYAVALKLDLALFTVYPSHDGPPMHWYGWIATAALGALMAGLVAALLPDRLTRWLWPGWSWVAAALAMIACVYLTLQ